MKKTITIEKIFRNEVDTKFGKKDTFVLIEGKVGYKGWGDGSDYKEGDKVDIEYNEDSKYEGKTITYYQLIQKKGDDLREVHAKLDRILKLLEGNPIPVIEDNESMMPNEDELRRINENLYGAN